MSKKSKELRAFVEEVLEAEGIERPYEFSIANNAHQQVVFHVKGIKVKYQFPGSPSDHRALLNARGSVRKAIRTATGFALSGAPEQRPVLDARGLLPRQPDHLGAGRAGAPQLAPSLRQRWPSCHRKTG